MEIIEFISWDDFGKVVTDNEGEHAFLSVKEYASNEGFDVRNRLGSAVKELLTLAKLYQFEYVHASRGYLFPPSILGAVFTTVIVSAHERDVILRGMREGATYEDRKAAYEIVESLLLEPPKFLLN